MRRLLYYIFRRRRFHHELDDEIQFHLEARAEELEQSGLPPADALAQARREFGPAARAREDTRAAWTFRWIEDLASDLRYALRAFRRDTAFVLAAVLSLALGIGANTTIFSLTMEFLFSEPSVRRPETLVNVRIGGNSSSPLREFRFLRDARILDGLAGSQIEASVNWRYGSDTYQLHVIRVTDNFFDVVGVPVAQGRPLRSGEDNVAVLSHRFWQSRLAAQPDILGRTLILDAKPYTVAGILPPNHRTLLGFGFAPELYLPLAAGNTRDSVAFVARLPEGMSRQVAFDRLRIACQELDKVYPTPWGGSWTSNLEVAAVAGVDRLKSVSQIPFAAFFGVLMIVVTLVLLIACANVASLLLARAASRGQELGIRLAIGAGRGRLVRQLLAESLLLATLGAIAGLALNVWLTGLMSRISLPLPIPVQLHIAPDWRLLSYASALALASAFFCGLLPALKATRADVNTALKLHERQVSARRWSFRNALVVGQLAVSILLLAAGFLFLRNLMKSTSMNPGFDVERTAWAEMRLVPDHYPSPDRVAARAAAALESLQALPGVESASIARMVPLNGASTRGGEVRLDGQEQPIRVSYRYNQVGPGYFRTMGIPIIQGREFLWSDRPGSPPVVIVNENFAGRYFGTTGVAGHTIAVAGTGVKTIVGVAKNSKYLTLRENNVSALYEPYFQQQPNEVTLDILFRTPGPPDALLRPATTVLTTLDPAAAVQVKPMRNALGLALLPSQVGGAILGTMGVLGLVLASLGLYGVLVYAVSRRLREIGIRLALGATSGDILRMLFRETSWLVGIGMAIGLGIAAFATRPLAMFLVPGLSPTDPTAFSGVVVVLAVVAALATAGPARRALRIDPLTALRYE